MSKHAARLAVVALVAACSEPVSLLPDPPAGDLSITANSPQPPSADSQFIVVLRPGVANADGAMEDIVRGAGGQLGRRYRLAISGFTAKLPAQALEGVRRNPNVLLVEPDGRVTTSDTVSATSWGIDRIDARDLPLDGSYASQNSGTGVRIYIVDTGIRFDHPEFIGRAGSGWDFIEGDADASDCQGHGTHVAGITAGSTVGVARGATLVSVRVLDCGGSGSWSTVIAGLEWIMANGVRPAVVNMSLSGLTSEAVNTAVENVVAAGIVVVVAAGNDDRDACGRSPAGAQSVITVAATTRTDARAGFSNWGSCVDLFAPGESIISAAMNGGYQSMSGTSMASPHVAGVAALTLSARPTATPSEVTAEILNGSSLDRVTDPQGTANRLLFSLVAGSSTLPPLPPPPPPVAAGKLRVTDLDATPVKDKKAWSAGVSIQARDQQGKAASFATVSGTWTEGASGTVTCTTNVYGWCTVTKSGLKNGVAAVRFTINTIALPGGTYDGSLNSDPESDSNGTTIKVSRP
jgi:serine protease